MRLNGLADCRKVLSRKSTAMLRPAWHVWWDILELWKHVGWAVATFEYTFLAMMLCAVITSSNNLFPVSTLLCRVGPPVSEDLSTLLYSSSKGTIFNYFSHCIFFLYIYKLSKRSVQSSRCPVSLREKKVVPMTSELNMVSVLSRGKKLPSCDASYSFGSVVLLICVYI